jgi:hypothetical protein
MSSRSGLIANAKRKILDLADNNKRRWSQFTGDVPFRFPVFSKKLSELQIARTPDEANIVWAAFNVQGNEMNFREFVQFLQNDKIDVSDPKPSAPISVVGLLHKHRKPLIDFCISMDPTVEGTVLQRQLIDFAISNGIISDASGLSSVISRFDPYNTGKVNYFKLMVDILQNAETTVPAVENHPEESRARKNLDTTIFGEGPSQLPKISDGGRHDLDPSIFGPRPTKTAVSAAPSAPLDLAGARDCTDYNQEQTLSLIARVANDKYRSLRDCFGSWRGTADRMSWEDIYRAMVTYGKVELRPEVLEAIGQEYGGEITVAGFTRLVSEGARLNTPEPVREAPAPLTDRDLLLNKIAVGLKGKPWEPALKGSKNALDLARNLKKLGVDMKSDELRSAFEDLGMKRFCDEIKQRQTPPKRRGG